MSETTTDAEVRAMFVSGFRALAEFLDSHPALPVPRCSISSGLTIYVGAADRDQVDRIAEILGVTPYEFGLYQAERRFDGTVAYRVVAVPEAADTTEEA
jgi:hypothetical protein